MDDLAVILAQLESWESKAHDDPVLPGELRRVQGYASVFGNVDLHGDIVEAGAFTKALAKIGNELPIFWEHEHSLFGPGLPIGKTTRLFEDDHGLGFEGVILDTERGRDVATLLDSQTVGESSFAFRILDSDRNEQTGIRSLKELDITEVSVVVWGANPQAEVSIAEPPAADGESTRGAVEAIRALDEINRALQAHGS
jgi:HK97 family phage prohead protease